MHVGHVVLLLLVPLVGSKLAPLHKAKVRDEEGQYLVGLKKNHDVEDWLKKFQARVETADLKHAKVTDQILGRTPILTAELDAEALSHVREMEGVEYIEENGVVEISGYHNQIQETFETDVGDKWGLDRIDQRQLPLNDVFWITGTGNGTHIYILDSGIRPTHEDIRGRASIAYDAYGGNGHDIDGHGTHCAGIAAGTRFGVAKLAHVHGVRVIKAHHKGTVAGVVRGMVWVAQNGRRPCVASMSFSGSKSKSLDDSAQYLHDSGCVLAVAASNEDEDSCGRSPANVKDVITVGASSPNDEKCIFSDYGKCVNIFAPGENILSLDYHSDTATVSKSGTSMATPFVAGASAVLLGRGVRPQDVREELQRLSTKNVIRHPEGTPNRLLYLD